MTSTMLRRARVTDLSATPVTVTPRDTDIYGWTIINKNPTAVYVKVYGHGDHTVGTSTPVTVIPVPAGVSTNPGLSVLAPERPYHPCCGGLAIACVTGLEDSDTTAPSVGIYCELIVDY